MKMINSPRRSNAITTAASNAPQHIAIRQRYGSTEQLVARFMPANLANIYAHRERSEEVEAPAMVNIIKAYGMETMEVIIRTYINKVMAFFRVEESRINNDAVREIASNLLLDQDFRRLNVAFALSFFQELMNGHYELYDFSPFRFMKAAHEYCQKALARQQQLYSANEERKRAEQRAADEKNAITWEEFCRIKGCEGWEKNPIDAFKTTSQREEARQ